MTKNESYIGKSMEEKTTTNKRGPWFKTFSGVHFYLFNPHEEDVRLIDIATHLSVLTRFGGALGVNYSVGHHSLLMQRITQIRKMGIVPQWLALMHDAAEAYVGDVVHPFKVEMPLVKKTEDNILSIIGSKYDIQILPFPDWLKKLDRQVCKAEANHFGMGTDDWTEPEYMNAYDLTGHEESVLFELEVYDALKIRKLFKKTFYELYEQIFSL